MLAVDGVELAAGLLEAAGVEVGEALIVEHVGRIGLLDIGGEIDVVVLRHAAGNERGSHGDRSDSQRRPNRPARLSLFTKYMTGLSPFGVAIPTPAPPSWTQRRPSICRD